MGPRDGFVGRKQGRNSNWWPALQVNNPTAFHTNIICLAHKHTKQFHCDTVIHECDIF